jgi:hypothetical protein
MQELFQLEEEIRHMKEQLLSIGDMRSGSLTQQFHDRKNKKGAYWSLSYTYQMKGRTEYVRPEHLRETRKQIAQYKKFKKLTTRWVDLALELCRRKREIKKSKVTS